MTDLNQEIKFKLPYGIRHAHSVYLIDINKFQELWGKTAPEQADRNLLSGNKISGIKIAIKQDPDTVIPLPHIRIGIMNGNAEGSVIDGRHRLAALKEMGLTKIPCLVDSHNSEEELLELGFISPLPEEMKKKIEEVEGAGELQRKLEASNRDTETLEDKKKWAATQEGRETLEPFIRFLGLQIIAEELYQYYLDNGKMPKKEEIEAMKAKAEVQEEPEQELEQNGQRSFLARIRPSSQRGRGGIGE